MTSSHRVRAGQFSQALRQGGVILVALALPRLGVGREAIGQWETLLFLGYVLGFGWTTGLLQGFLVRMGELEERDTLPFARLAVAAMAVASAGLLLLATALHPWLFSALRLEGAPPGWYYYFVLLLSQWPSYCFEQALLVTGRIRLLLVYAAASAGGFVLVLLLPLWLGLGLETSLRWLAIYGAVRIALLAVWSVRPWRYFAGAGAQVRTWWRASRSLVAYASVGALVTAFDPWFVNYWYGGDEAVFATFRYGVRELPLLAALINGMTVVAIPYIASDRAEGLALLRDQSRRLFHFVFALTLLLMLTAGWWWTLVFTPTFADSLPVFLAYLLVVGCRLVFAMTVLTALNQTRWLYLSGLVELAINLVLSWLLVGKYGLVGIVWATVIASYLHELFLVLYLRWRTATSWRTYASLEWYLGYSVVLVVAYWWVG